MISSSNPSGERGLDARSIEEKRMDEQKIHRLIARGWRVGNADEFLVRRPRSRGHGYSSGGDRSVLPGSGGEEGHSVSRALDYPQVTEDLLQEAVRRILAVGAPDKIVLFGSRARGDTRVDSDLDLLIIEASDLPRYKRSSRYLRALVGLFPAKDVVVWTPEEVEVWSEVPHAFITTALREGKTLCGR